MKQVSLRCSSKRLLLLPVFFLLVVLVPFSAQADKVTPSHVYQAVEELYARLDQAQLVDATLFKASIASDVLYHPRHVMQKVGECHSILAKALQERGYEISDLPRRISLQEVRPTDVKGAMDHLLSQVRRAFPEQEDITPPFVGGKVPGDVYNFLGSVCGAISVSVTPSDIYKVAATVKANVEDMYYLRGHNVHELEVPSVSSLPETHRVYLKVRELLMDVHALALHPDFAIPGGVVLVGVDETTMPPSSLRGILSLMHYLVAETEAIKYALHMHTPKDQRVKLSKDSSLLDTYEAVSQAHFLVKEILQREENIYDTVKAR